MTRRAKLLGAVLGALTAGVSAWGCGGNTANPQVGGQCDGGAACETSVSPGCVDDAACASSGACTDGGCVDGASEDGAGPPIIDGAPPECNGLAGSACTPSNASCRRGVIVCSNGISLCLETPANMPEGTACGGGNVCEDGVCVAECDGGACGVKCPGPGCDGGTTCSGPGCDGGTTCTGSGCDAGMTCASAGMSCPLPGVCYYGIIQCISGQALCETGMPLPNGSSCGGGSICFNGNCNTQLYLTAAPPIASSSLSVGGMLFNVIDILNTDSPSALTAVLDWGDGTTSNGTVAGSAGTFTVSGSHSYTALGGYTVTVTLSDPATDGVVTLTTTVSVGFTVFPVANVGSSITAGPDGNLWFTIPYTNQIGRMTPAGVVTSFAIPTAGAGPTVIAPGPDGNLWFTENASNKIASITPLGVFTEYDIPTLGSQPAGIAAGADGDLWYTEGLGDKIGRISPTGTNAAEFSIPIAAAGPGSIVAGPDGNMWFTLANVGANTSAVATITPAGVIKVIMLPTEYGAYDLTVGPDGNVWYATLGTTALGRITPSGTVTEVEVGMQSTAIAVGSDNNLWFIGGNYGADTRNFGKVTLAGVTTAYTLPFGPTGLTTGPDGNLWLTDYDEIVMVVP